MADDKPSPEQLEQLKERISYLELLMREQLGRLYAIEQRLGLTYRPPFARQPAPPAEQRTVLAPSQVEVRSKEVAPSTPAAERLRDQETPLSPRQPTAAEKKAPPAPPSAAELTAPSTTASPRETPQPTAPSSGVREGTMGSAGLAGSAPPTRPPEGAPSQATRPPRPQTQWPATGFKPARPLDEEPRTTLEARIGGSLFTWIGAIAVCLGVGFFLKWAVDNRIIAEAARVWMGAGLGVGFLVGGEWLRRKYPNYAYVLSGIGLVTLYLVVWAAFTRYHLIPQLPAFTLMALITLTASLLAARYNAYSIAILALIGGFATPIMLSTGQNNEVGLFSYVALLDAGVLVLAYSKRWRSLNYLAFLATLLMFAGWMDAWYDPSAVWTTFGFLSLVFVIFALLAVFYNVINRTPTGWLDLALVFANAIIYFGTSYALLEDRFHPLLGAFAVFVSAFYLGLGYFTYWRDRDDRLLVLTFLGLAFLFIVLAVPIQLDQHWVTMAWAIEGAIMTWIGLQVNDRTSRYAGLLVFVIAVSHWALVDVNNFGYHSWGPFTPLLNRRALSCAVLAGALAATAFLFKRQGSELEEQERSLFSGLYLLGANLLAVTLLSLDANDYFEQKKYLARQQPGPPAAAVELSRLNRSQYLTLTELWTLYGAITLIVGIVRSLKPLRVIGLILLAVATFALVTVELGYYAAGWQTTVFNPVFSAFGLMIAALAIAARFYSRSAQIESEERALAVPVMIGAANVLAILALSGEVIGHFERVKSGHAGELASIDNTKQFVLTAVWVIYGVTALMVGIKRRLTPVRWGALLLLAMATAKVLLVDLRYYEAAWHLPLANRTLGAFALLVIGLALAARFYRRSEAISEEGRLAMLYGLIGAATVLALIGLSAEVMGHYGRLQAPILAREGYVEAFHRYGNTKHMMLSWLWTIYATAALIVGLRRKLKPLRWAGLGLLALATVKVLTVDAGFYDAGWHTLVFNQTFAALAMLIAGLALSVRFYARSESIDDEERGPVVHVLTGAANVLAIIALSADAVGHYRKLINAPGITGDELSDLALARQLSLSVIWTVYGGAMLAVGMLKRNRLLRVMALLLLGLTIGKVFFVDLTFLAKLYRTISFIVLGLILLAVSYLYQRYRQRVSDMTDDDETQAARTD